MFLAIQYLRAVAAIAVVIRHASHPGGALEQALDGGVDLFFVISGVVMVLSTHGKDIGPVEFLAKRARRIFPMWWATLAVVVVLGLGHGDVQDWLLSVALIPSTIAFGVGSVSWGVGWTLVFEICFYVIFAIGLVVRSDRVVIWGLPLLVAAGVAFGRTDIPILNTILHPLMVEFLFGFLIGQMLVAGVRLPGITLVLCGAALYVLASIMVLVPQEFRWLFRSAPLALVVMGLIGIEQRRWLPRIPALQFLGDASYSIYLLHYVAIMLAWMVVPRDSFWLATGMGGVLLGCFAYAYVERPLLKAMRPRAQPA